MPFLVEDDLKVRFKYFEKQVETNQTEASPFQVSEKDCS